MMTAKLDPNPGKGPLLDAAPPSRVPEPIAPRRRSGLRPATIAAALAFVLALGAFLGGFLVFVNTLARQETEFGRQVDAVVALTGGADRIADALSVLAEGRARRLLITGVHPNTTEASLIRYSGHRALFDCCVDIDRQALNTLGNAREASRWAREKGAKTLMLVTSSYHMPRALLELRRFSPDRLIVPHPVISESGHPANWRRDPALARLLLAEYVKYLRARVRRWYDPTPALDRP